MNTYKKLAVTSLIAMTGLLGACGEDSDLDRVDIDGHYSGVQQIDGFGFLISGVISEYGDAVLYSSTGDYFYAGMLSAATGRGIDGLFRAYTHIPGADTDFAIYGSSGGGTTFFEGTGVSREFISGVLSGRTERSRMDLEYQNFESSRSGMVSSLAGVYEGRDGGAYWRMELTAGGSISGDDDAGCVYSGTLGLNAGSNTYAVQDLRAVCGVNSYLFDGVAYRTSSGLGLSLYDSGTVIVADLPSAGGG